MNIKIFKPHEIQKQILRHLYNPEVSFVSVCAGRRLGKTALNVNYSVDVSLRNDNNLTGIIVPSAKQLNDIFSYFLKYFEKAPFVSNIDKTHKIAYLGNNSCIKWLIGSFPSAETIRGNEFNHLILDEVVMMQEKLWTEVLMATMATSLVKPKTLFTSTPKSSGDWFYKNCMKGLDVNERDYRYVHAPSTANPHVRPDFIELMRKTLTQKAFNQEIMAMFSENSGSLFENVSVLTHNENCKYDPNRKYFAGIDTGLIEDYTVVVIVDDQGKVVDHIRINQIDLKKQAKEIYNLLIKWKSPKTLIEINAYSSLIDYIKDCGYKNIETFWTGTGSKSEIIEDLCVVFSNSEILIPNETYFVSEFMSFTYEYNLKTRNITYSAPAGLHDDIVMATAIAFKCRKDNVGKRFFSKVL